VNRRLSIPEDRPIAGVNVVPVIDLCLVLLVVLLVTAPILNQPSLPIKLPQATTIESKDKNISVTCSKDGRYGINTDIVDRSQIREKLRKMLADEPESLVIVRVDKEATYGSLTDILSLVKGSGARRLAIGTEQKPVKVR
jgi:biopolymer transport protein ExbD